MDRITDTLYLGSYEDALCAAVSGAGICSTFNLAQRSYDAVLPGAHWPIADEVYHPPAVWAAWIAHLAAHLLRAEGPVLVHCRLGVSCSPALVAAYLAWSERYQDHEAALAYVRTCRSVVNVHPETWRGVAEWYQSRYGGHPWR